MKISSQSVHKFLSNPANKNTNNKQKDGVILQLCWWLTMNKIRKLWYHTIRHD